MKKNEKERTMEVENKKILRKIENEKGKRRNYENEIEQ
jgi:hypothetical protein